MADDATPPELPPGLLAEYLQNARAQLSVLAGLAARLSAAGDDREALEELRREAHKVHGSAGSYGFMEASRLAAGMEVTLKDWVARPDDLEVDRGSLARWFVGRLAEMLGVPAPRAPVTAPRGPATAAAPPLPPPPPPPPPPSSPRAPLPRVGSPPRPSRTPAAPARPGGGPPSPKPAVSAPKVPPPAPQAPAQSPRTAPKPKADAAPAAPAAPAASGDALNVPEVIYVEDDPALAELLDYGLRAHGYRFAAYRNGREALRELLALDVRGTRPLLLLDVDLPALDGYSIFDALQRERPATYRVVFTTVHGTEEEQLRGLEAGALDYLVKPISLRVALEKIKRWVGR